MRKFTILAVLLAGGLLSCNSRSNVEQDFAQEVEMLERKTTPPEAEVIAHSGPVRSNWFVTASWEIETKLSPSDYSKLIVTRLSDFKVLKESDSDLALSKPKGNDTYVIECKFTQMNAEFRVLVAFSARPD